MGKNKRRGGTVRKYNLRVIGAAEDPCVICGKKAESIDHISPLSKNGPDHALNWAPMCVRCNCRKDTQTILFALLDYKNCNIQEKITEQKREEEFELNRLRVCSWLQ